MLEKVFGQGVDLHCQDGNLNLWRSSVSRLSSELLPDFLLSEVRNFALVCELKGEESLEPITQICDLLVRKKRTS